MMESLQSLISNPWFYLVIGTLWAGARIGLKRLIEQAVDHRFALRLESHKHDLQRLAEVERFHLQRELTGAGLYLGRQHSAAAEIYSAIRVAHGSVSSLFGFQRGLSFDGCNEADIRDVLAQSEVLQGKQDDLVALWRRDPKAAAEAIAEHLRDLAVPRAENKLQEARNLMYVNEIYFSDAAIAAFDGFVGECNKWILRRTYPPQRGEKVELVSREKLDGALDLVQTTLRAELGGGPAASAKSVIANRPAPDAEGA